MPKPFVLPGTRPQYAPDRVVDVKHINLELVLEVEKKHLIGTCTKTVVPIVDGVTRLCLDAVEMEIHDVSLRDGTKLHWSHDGKKLRIDLGKPRRSGQELIIAIRYSAYPRRGLYFVAPDEAYPDRPTQVWSQGQDEDSRFWFPCFDSPLEKATSELTATVPASFFALSNGDLIELTEDVDAGTKTYHWMFDVPHSCYLITLAAGELAEIEDRWNDVDLFYYVQKGREDDARRALGRTPKMMELFSRLFGCKYPYTKYAQVCVAEFIFGGMENTTATTLTDVCLYDERAALDFDMDDLVAHELAHQWLGDLVTCREWGQGWLNEGWATYSEYLWRTEKDGRAAADVNRMVWADQYFGEDSSRYRRPIATNVYDEPIDIFDHHLYEKGGLVLHMLRDVLGEELFWRAVRHYIEKHRHGSVETKDFVRAIEEATGRNLDWFFDQWVHKAGHPELEVSYAWDEDNKLAKLTVKQTQKVEGDTPVFRIPTRVRFRVRGKDLTVPVEIQDAWEVFHFPLEVEPTHCIFDPGQHILKRLELEKPRNLWLAELAGASEAIDRIQAAKALRKFPTQDVVDALAAALDEDEFWGVQAAAAESLGAVRMESARDVLVAAVRKTRHPKARRAVVRALGEYQHDETAAAALEKVVLGGDKSYFVEAEACLALGKTRSERAKAALREALSRESYLDVIRQHAYRGLAEARDESALDLLVAGTRYGFGNVSHGRRAAAAALASLFKGRRDREGRTARECLEALLFDKDFRVKQSAVEAIATFGDPQSVPALRKLIDLELDGRVRRRAREVIRDLQDGTSKDEAIKSLKDEVERLRRELFSLRDKLGQLQAKDEKSGKPTAARKKPTPKKKPGGAKKRAR